MQVADLKTFRSGAFWLLVCVIRTNVLKEFFLVMAEVLHDAQQDFWRPPSTLNPATEVLAPSEAVQDLAEACGGCGSEFMIGARFCHTCGLSRPVLSPRAVPITDATVMAGLWNKNVALAGAAAESLVSRWQKIPFPAWLRYLHFHEIKRWVGLPTAALVAFIIGLGCVGGALGVSFFYKASNLAEFQAIQMWRVEWLLAATASFVAGILLKKPSDNE